MGYKIKTNYNQIHYLKTIGDIVGELSEHSLMKAQDILENEWIRRNELHS